MPASPTCPPTRSASTRSSCTGTRASRRPTTAAGGLQTLTGRDIKLKYGPDGQALEHALIDGDAVIQLAGDTGTPGRQITANTVDIALAPDGSTPTALVGREGVQLTFPADRAAPRARSAARPSTRRASRAAA